MTTSMDESAVAREAGEVAEELETWSGDLPGSLRETMADAVRLLRSGLAAQPVPPAASQVTAAQSVVDHLRTYAETCRANNEPNRARIVDEVIAQIQAALATATRGGQGAVERYPGRVGDAPDGKGAVRVVYTNWRGDTGERTILPSRLFWGSNKWHPEPQWLLEAYDFGKKAMRVFAQMDVHSWEDATGLNPPTPEHGNESPPVAAVDVGAREALKPFAALADEIEQCAGPGGDPRAWSMSCSWRALVQARAAYRALATVPDPAASGETRAQPEGR